MPERVCTTPAALLPARGAAPQCSPRRLRVPAPRGLFVPPPTTGSGAGRLGARTESAACSLPSASEAPKPARPPGALTRVGRRLPAPSGPLPRAMHTRHTENRGESYPPRPWRDDRPGASGSWPGPLLLSARPRGSLRPTAASAAPAASSRRSPRPAEARGRWSGHESSPWTGPGS